MFQNIFEIILSSVDLVLFVLCFGLFEELDALVFHALCYEVVYSLDQVVTINAFNVSKSFVMCSGLGICATTMSKDPK